LGAVYIELFVNFLIKEKRIKKKKEKEKERRKKKCNEVGHTFIVKKAMYVCIGDLPCIHGFGGTVF
jgi:hypothetical protein